MPNGKMSEQLFKKMSAESQNWYLYEQIIDLKADVAGLHKKFSKKWVETLVIWAGGIAGGAIILAFMGSILIK